MVKTITITEAQEKLPEIIEEVSKDNVTYIITINSIPKAVISSVDGNIAFQNIKEDKNHISFESLTYN